MLHPLSGHHRRFALYYPFDRDRPVPLDELVEQIVMRNEVFTPDSREQRRDVRRGLEANWLPELVDYGVVSSEKDAWI